MIYSISTNTLPTGLQNGDRVFMKPGNYAGLKLTGLSGITFLPDTSDTTLLDQRVIFTSDLILGNTNNLTFDGLNVFLFVLNGGKFAPQNGNNINLSLKNWDFGKSNVVFDGTGDQVTYTGTPASALYYGLNITGFKFSGNIIYNGTWDAAKTYHNVCIGMSWSNGAILNDGTTQSTKLFGNSIYSFLASDILITGENPHVNDVGIFMIQSGNETLQRIKRIGGYGYLTRLWQVGLGSRQDSSIINCIDYGTDAYGTADVRIDSTLLSSNAKIPLVGGNINFYFNTSGDKTDNGAYVTPLVVIGSMTDDLNVKYAVNVVNNFAFNAMQSAMANNTSLIKDNSGGAATINKQNNIDIVGPLPAGYLVDKINFQPASQSKLIAAGMVIPSVIGDINKNARTSPPDVGAVQSGAAVVIPSPPPPVPTIKYVQVTYSDGTVKTIS